jgi:hypothetical protein
MMLYIYAHICVHAHACTYIHTTHSQHIALFEERQKSGEKFGDADGDMALASAAGLLRDVERNAHKQKVCVCGCVCGCMYVHMYVVCIYVHMSVCMLMNWLSHLCMCTYLYAEP